MAAKKKAEADLWTPNQEEAEVYVNTLKVAMTVFNAAKLSDDHRAILDALNDEFHGLVHSVSLKHFLSLLWTLYLYVTYISGFPKAVLVYKFCPSFHLSYNRVWCSHITHLGLEVESYV